MMSKKIQRYKIVNIPKNSVGLSIYQHNNNIDFNNTTPLQAFNRKQTPEFESVDTREVEHIKDFCTERNRSKNKKGKKGFTFGKKQNLLSFMKKKHKMKFRS